MQKNSIELDKMQFRLYIYFCDPNEKSEYYGKMTLSQEDIKKNYTKKLGQQDKRTIKGSKG